MDSNSASMEASVDFVEASIGILEASVEAVEAEIVASAASPKAKSMQGFIFFHGSCHRSPSCFHGVAIPMKATSKEASSTSTEAASVDGFMCFHGGSFCGSSFRGSCRDPQSDLSGLIAPANLIPFGTMLPPIRYKHENNPPQEPSETHQSP